MSICDCRFSISRVLAICCFAAVASLSAAADPQDRASDTTIYVDPGTVGNQMAHNGGSLYRASVVAQPDNHGAHYGSASFFSVPPETPRTIKKHDIVIVIIREESDASAKGTSDLKKQYDFDAILKAWIALKPGNTAIQGGAQGATPPEIGLNANRDLKGEATVDRTDSFSARIAAEVIDVKPNGSVVLSSTKHVKNDDEEQFFRLTGTCRAEDVTADNTILSTQLADLDVSKTTTGAVRDTTKRGFIPKILDQINPF